MILLVFGAGASYDSMFTDQPFDENEHPPNPHAQNAERDEVRLPLTSEILADRRQFTAFLARRPQLFGMATPLASASRSRAGGKVFEDLLQEYAEESLTNARLRGSLISLRYYLRDIISNCELHWVKGREMRLNHISLFHDLDGIAPAGQVAVVTFNYDTLIERGLNVNGYYFGTMESYIEGSRFKLFKLHGSINWRRSVAVPAELSAGAAQFQEQEGFLSGANVSSALDLLDDFKRIDADAPGFHMPAIAVPITAKPTFECPSSHQAALWKLLPDVDTVITFGWRGQEAHFLQKLRELAVKPLRIYSVGRNFHDGSTIAASIGNAMTEFDSIDAWDGNFSSFVGSRMIRDVIRSTL